MSADFRTLIDRMLEKDPAKRPDAVSIIKLPFIWRKVMMIVEEEMYGQIIAEQIKEQLIELGLLLPDPEP